LLERTRSAVLNVLVGVGAAIALGGWLLRGRAEAGRPVPPRGLHEVLMIALVALAASSYALRRLLARRAARLDPGRREPAFFRAHVLPAAIAALAAPLGIAYGWWVAPRLEAVIPFWVVPLALGFLAIPRAHEVDELERRSPDPGTPAS
jgi:hypothetical protein